MLKEGLSERSIAVSVGVSKSQNDRISAVKETLTKHAEGNVFKPSAKVMADLSHHQELEKKVLSGFRKCEILAAD